MSPESLAEPCSPAVRSNWLRGLAVAACLLCLQAFATLPLHAAPDPPVQVYYLPMPEDQALTTLRALYPGNDVCGLVVPEVEEPVTSYVSVSVIVSGTHIYYDHWEDGYEASLAEPQQDTTEVWGDGDLSNGIAPGYATDLLAANSVVVLHAPDANPGYDYNGRDRLGATRLVAVTRAMWAAGTKTLHAGALEVYPVGQWGTAFRAPAGVDTPFLEVFEYTALAIMAAEDGTQVTLDLDGDGVFDPPITLGQGESYLTAGTVAEGAAVNASAPVQVAMVAGDICAIFETRWYVLFPVEQWDSRYYNPVSTDPAIATTALLYNPHATPLTVTREISGSVVTTLEVPAGSTLTNTMLPGSGAGFASVDGRPFSAIAAVDTFTNTEDYDWGLDLVPARRLTSQTLIGWGAGRDPGSSLAPDENGNPVWVMGVLPDGVAGPIEICVDYDGDNSAANQDSNGFFYDVKLVLPEFANARVYDPVDADQTGMLLYICDGSVGTGAQLVAAWGADPEVASPGEPGLDVGTTAPPAASFESGKSADLLDDRDGDGKADAGDSLRYTIVVRNASRVDLPNVVVSDTLPLSTTYVLSSTTVNTGTTPVALPDGASGTPFPLDEGGIDLGPMPIAAVFTVAFGVRLDEPLPVDVTEIVNRATVVVGDETEQPEVVTPVDRDPGIALVKSADHSVAISGTVVAYTFTVSNVGTQPLQAVNLVDSHCTAAFASGDTNGDDVLDLDELWLYTCSAVITQTTVNTATVTAQNEDEEEVSAIATWTVRLFSGKLYLPIIRTPRVVIPCPPPDGCPLTTEIKAMAVHEGAHMLYVVSRNPDRLLKVEPDGVEIVAEAPTGAQPWGIVVNEQTNRVYVSNYAGGDVWVYDADTLEIVDKLAVGEQPALLDILPELDTVVVLLQKDSRVAIIEGLEVQATISSAGSFPFGIAADVPNQRVYISHRDSHSMSMLRREGGVWQAFPGPILADKRQLFELAYNPDTQILYSVHADTEGAWKLAFWEPKAVGDWGQFGMVDLPSGGELGSPDVGGAGLAVNLSTENVFNVNTGAASLSVVDGAVPAILGGVALGNDPFAIAVDSSTDTVYIGLRASGNLVKVEDTY